MVGDDVLGLLEPEVGDLGEDLALVGDRRGQDVVEGRDAVAGDDDEVLVAWLVDVAHLASAQKGQAPLLGFEHGGLRHGCSPLVSRPESVAHGPAWSDYCNVDGMCFAEGNMIVPKTGHKGMGYLLKVFVLSRLSRRQGRMFTRSSDPAGPEPKKGRAERFWDRAALTFDSGPKKPDEDVGRALAKTRPYLRAGDTVLDYGCATGHVTLRIATDVKMVHGIDISSQMIAVARRKAEERRIENVRFSRSTIDDEAYAPGSFDVVLAFNVLHLVEDVQRVVYRIADLLRPGGLFISTTPCLGERNAWVTKVVRMGVRLLSRLGLIPYVGVYRVLGLQNTIDAAGLVAVEMEKLEHTAAVHFIAAHKPVVPW